MKKFIFVLPILAIIFAWCNKTTVIVEEPQLETVEQVECIDWTIESYMWGFDISKSAIEVENLKDYTTAIITAKFTDHFINNYRYEDSDKFFFGLKIYVWNHTDNGWYYNVLRARTEWLANWTHLTGLVPAIELKDWFTWTIPLNEEINVANKTFIEWKQFVKVNLSNYEWNRIGAYLSATKELAWWELWEIKIKLCK